MSKSKYLYLILAIIGFIVPNIYMVLETMNTGNFMLWLDAKHTLSVMFTNNITSFFMSDLLYVGLVFFIWSYRQALRYRMKNVYLIWVLSLLLGLGGPFPLFLYMRENARRKIKGKSTKTRRMSSSDSKED